MTIPPFEAGQPHYLLLATGALMLLTALLGPRLRAWPVSTAMIYLAAGALAGLPLLGAVRIDVVGFAPWLEPLSEAAVLISLFVSGFMLDSRAGWRRWRCAVQLASVSMVLTIAAITLLGHLLLGLPWGFALLLGAVLAPTDPILASDVQVERPDDRDILRFGLTGEAGLNDGTAFPFVMLALGWIGLHDLGSFGARWFAVDVVWAIVAGIGSGALVGTLAGRALMWSLRGRDPSLTMNEFVAIGTVLAATAAAKLIESYAFLAVFAAAIALRRALERAPPRPARHQIAEAAAHEEVVEQKMAEVLDFNSQLERIGEFLMVTLVGVMLWSVAWSWALVVFIVLLLFVIRPGVVRLTLPAHFATTGQRRLFGWFGIRGIGSIYYLAYALHAGVADDGGRAVASATLAVIATSIALHGISVTPLMRWYARRPGRKPSPPGA